MKHIVLGSESPNRKKVLEDLGIPFEVIKPMIDEKAIRDQDPSRLTALLAKAKAEAVLAKLTTQSIIITSDQVVVVGGEIREKPDNDEMARQYLIDISEGKLAQTVTSLCITDSESGKQVCDVDIASVQFNPFPTSLIDKLVAQKRFSKNAGGFAIQDPDLAPYVAKFDGEIESIIGLPVSLLKKLLSQFEIIV